jgi:hypothetical protein
LSGLARGAAIVERAVEGDHDLVVMGGVAARAELGTGGMVVFLRLRMSARVYAP